MAKQPYPPKPKSTPRADSKGRSGMGATAPTKMTSRAGKDFNQARRRKAIASAAAKKQASRVTSAVTKPTVDRTDSKGRSQLGRNPGEGRASRQTVKENFVKWRKAPIAKKQASKAAATNKANRVSASKEAGMVRSAKAKASAANTKSSAGYAKSDAMRRSVKGVKPMTSRAVSTRQAEDRVVARRKARNK